MYYDNILKKSALIYTNRDLIEGEIKGICLRLHAYGGPDRIYEPEEMDSALAKAGILTVFPFYDVWGWGNDKNIALVNAVLDGVRAEYSLENAPLVLYGEGVGGTLALNCLRRGLCAKGCLALCPVTDLEAHARVRGDMEAVLFYAFRHGEMPFEDAVKASSPALHTDEMPDVKYYFVTAGQTDQTYYRHRFDRGIDAETQYLAYAKALEAKGFDVTQEELDIAHAPLPTDAEKRCAEIIASLF